MEWLAPLLGFTGVLVGATIQTAAAVRNQRTQYNIAATNETKAYLVRAIQAADHLHLVHGLDLAALKRRVAEVAADAGHGESVINFRYERTEDLQKRIDEVTAEWRAVLTMRYLLAPTPVADNLSALDLSRATFIDLLQSGRVNAAINHYESDLGARVRLVKLGVNVVSQHLNVILSRSFLNPWDKKERKLVWQAYTSSVERYNEAESEVTSDS